MRNRKIRFYSAPISKAGSDRHGRIWWRVGVSTVSLALAILSGALISFDAQALALGRITVQSALGEPMRAEIDVVEINAEEAASLQATVASTEAFKLAGLEYNPVLSELEITLERRANGKAFFNLRSRRPVADPFVDLIVEIRWALGRISREYTMLFDLPNLRQASTTDKPAVLVQPPIVRNDVQMPAVVTPSAQRPPEVTALPPLKETDKATAGSGKPDVVAEKTVVEKKPTNQTSTEKIQANNKQVTVQAGDTAGKIAAQYKPARVSLDQMLVALLRSNPGAFTDGNVNRLKAGAVLDLPSGEAVSEASPQEAKKMVLAQSKNFQEFRKTLAENAAAAPAVKTGRQSSGQVQAKLEDKVQIANASDKLTIAKGTAQGQVTAEEKIAAARQAKELEERKAELDKNIAALKLLRASAAQATDIPVQSPAAAPVALSSAPLAVASSNEAKPAVSAPVASSTVAPTVAVTSPPVPPPLPNKKASAPAEPATQGSLIDELMDDPLVLGGVGALLLLMLVFFAYRLKRARNQNASPLFSESHIRQDSFFGDGGRQIDTDNDSVGQSSMVYSPSQLDATGDVDPLAEADVYLAYGRDLQAEEILKEALKSNPLRLVFHTKLLEIYAKRQDTKAFEKTAIEIFDLTNGVGSEWTFACGMGQKLDPDNPIYRSGWKQEKNAQAASSKKGASGTGPAPGYAGYGTKKQPTLDFSSGSSQFKPTVILDAPEDGSASQKLGADNKQASPSFPGAPVVASLNVSLGQALNEKQPAPKVTSPVAAQSAPSPVASNMLDFDSDMLSLTPRKNTNTPPSGTPTADDGLQVKLALAEQFRDIGDIEGARELAQEVASKAQGELQARARDFLKNLA